MQLIGGIIIIIVIGAFSIKKILSFKLIPATIGVVGLFSLFYTIVKEPSCGCVAEYFLLSHNTKRFFDNFLEDEKVEIFIRAAFLISIILFLINKALLAQILGAIFDFARSILFIILMAFVVKLIVGCIACPLLCGHFTNWNSANECIWETIRRAIGTK